MITLQNLLDYSEAKGLSSELYGVCDSLKYSFMKINDDYIDWEYGFRIKFGFEFKPNVYYWFSTMVMSDDGSEIDMNLPMDFKQRYNMSNGACQKTFTKGWECEKVINAFLN